MAVGKAVKKIVSETAHATLALTAAQARSSFVDFMAVWEEFAIFRERRKSFIITDNGLVSNGANKDSKSGSRHIIGGEEDSKKRETCEAKARNKNNEIRE
jgi:hypothetical protein